MIIVLRTNDCRILSAVQNIYIALSKIQGILSKSVGQKASKSQGTDRSVVTKLSSSNHIDGGIMNTPHR